MIIGDIELLGSEDIIKNNRIFIYMKKVIRLTETDLNLIVRRVIKESKKINESEQMMKKQAFEFNSAMKSFSSCFSASKYPKLYSLFKAVAHLGISILEFSLGIIVVVGGLVCGASGVCGATLAAAVATAGTFYQIINMIAGNMFNDFAYSLKEIKKVLMVNPNLYAAEILKLVNCIYNEFVSYSNSLWDYVSDSTVDFWEYVSSGFGY